MPKKVGKGPLPKSLQKKLKFYVLKSTQKQHENIIKDNKLEQNIVNSSHEILNIINNLCLILDDNDMDTKNIYDNYRKFLDEEFQDNNLKKKRKYFVACQNNSLRGQLGGIPGVPLLYMNKVALVMEPPSNATLRYTSKHETNKVNVPVTEQESLNKINQILKPKSLQVISEVEGKIQKNDKTPRIKKKSSAPNPLSNKKSDVNSSKSKKKLANKFKK